MVDDIYTFKISDEELDKILNGKKDIHLCIAYPKRKSFAIGNQVTFVSDGAEPKTVKAKIEQLMYFSDYKEALDTLKKERCGFSHSLNPDRALDGFLTKESNEALEKYGIMAIIFVKQ